MSDIATAEPLGLSVERVRHEMLRGILIPRELVNEALRTTAAALHADETKFFSFKGHVTDMKNVIDHTTRLAAADQIFSLAGLYAREREHVEHTPTVAMEIDSTTGVMRLVVGSVPLALNVGSQTQELVPHAPVVQDTLPDSSLGAKEPVRVTQPPMAQALDKIWKIVSDEVVD